MLILTRAKDEIIKIGDDIEVMVVEIRGGRASLGIIAPAHVPVHRREIYEPIKREKAAAKEDLPA